MRLHRSRALHLRKKALAARHFARLFDPVLGERRLQLRDDRTFDARGDVAEVLLVLRRAEPVVGDAMPADPARAPVDDDDLSMIAIVQQADIAEAERMVSAHL